MNKLHLYNYFLDDNYGEIAVVGENQQQSDEYEVILDEAEDFRPYIELSNDRHLDYKVYLDELIDDRPIKDPIFN